MTQLQHLAGLIITGCVLSAQNVTVLPGDWSANGIEITPYSSPSFGAKVSGMPPSSLDLTSLYPFSFVLTNNTGHAIVAYSALWTMTHANGLVTRRFQLAGSLLSRQIGSSIPNGTDRLVTVITATSGPSNPNVLSNIQTSINHARNSFPSSGSVTVSLEAVVRDDGLALGPDSTQAIPRLRGEADGLKSIASDLLIAFNSGGNQAAVALLAGILAGPYPSSLAASRMSSADDAYAAFVAHTRYVMAQNWLRTAKGNAPLLERLAYQTANQASLAVHR